MLGQLDILPSQGRAPSVIKTAPSVFKTWTHVLMLVVVVKDDVLAFLLLLVLRLLLKDLRVPALRQLLDEDVRLVGHEHEVLPVPGQVYGAFVRLNLQDLFLVHLDGFAIGEELVGLMVNVRSVVVDLKVFTALDFYLRHDEQCLVDVEFKAEVRRGFRVCLEATGA
jgi:hypothetical protein